MLKKIHFAVVVLSFYLIVIGVACTQKTIPVISSRTTNPFKKEKPLSTITADLAIGKAVFINRCGTCHDLPQPEQFTVQRWERILSYMIPRAKLDDEQSIHVTAYLKANSLK